jgi:hypothetical protein
MNEERRKLNLELGYIEEKDCPFCNKPILTIRGEIACSQFAEAEHSIDCGEFSDGSAWDEFCEGHEIEDDWIDDYPGDAYDYRQQQM